MTTKTDDLTASRFLDRLVAMQSETERDKYRRYFPDTWAGFIGVRMGDVFALAREFVLMDLADIELVLESPAHEARAGAVRIMADQARRRGTTDERRRALAELYLRRHDRIDDWDLVDLGAWHVLGRSLLDGPRDVLDALAASPDRWRRRSAVLAPMAFVARGQTEHAFRLATRLVADPEDTVQKGVGWILRAAGDVDRPRLHRFLDEHGATMPRSTVRAAMEHLDAADRAGYLTAPARSRTTPA
jgi:3-methyladenine DNA glycosylase AlkD